MRAGQEAAKRIDLFSYYCGVNLKPTLRLKHGPERTFFFSPSELPSRLALLQKALPEQVDRIVAEAEEISRHEFRLLGYDKLNYGSEIDWHLDIVHGKRVPLKPWFKIKFLDFHRAGDHKVIWELNRHQHLVTLAKAWRLTGETRFLEELTTQWYAWHKANPYPLGINWASSLEVAFRSLSWLWVRSLVAGAREARSEFGQDLVRALALNGRHIHKYLSTYFSPNTHLLGEAVALFFIGTLCPELPASEQWQSSGWKILLAEAKRQVRSDGVYFEQALYYHVYALDFFLHARILAARNGICVPEQFDRVLRKMLTLVANLAHMGAAEGFGDDDGGRVFDPRRNQIEHMTDPLALGGAVYGEAVHGKELTEEAIWLLGEKAGEPAKLTGRECRVQAQAFTEGGIYIIRDSEPCPQQMIIDAGPQGVGHSGHGHADGLAVGFSLGGQRCLVDSGTYTYVSGQERDYFRGTGAHNTLRVDGLDQAIAEGPFSWSSLPKVQKQAWVAGRSFALFAGSQDGFARLRDPVTHTRLVFHRRGAFWLVYDHAGGTAEHQVDIAWHFSSEMTLKKQADNFVACHMGNRDPCLALLPVLDARWKSQLSRASLSPAYGRKIPAQVVRLTCQSDLPVDCASIIVPLGQDRILGSIVNLNVEWSHRSERTRGYRYRERTKDHYVIIPDGGDQAWTMGPIHSNARFLYLSVQNGSLTDLIFCGASMARLYGNTIVNSGRTLNWLELHRQQDGIEIHAPEGEPTEPLSKIISTHDLLNISWLE
ncbi:MAG: alginate lyase family protein [Acidobacteria bacterium]|nr:alginate lyase family protein [Acidobacteriota bacterium]